ncbi:hypothetical protein Hdeb2414_s0012g00378021 [Helianthus debilis subsp. tardiflorus]
MYTHYDYVHLAQIPNHCDKICGPKRTQQEAHFWPIMYMRRGHESYQVIIVLKTHYHTKTLITFSSPPYVIISNQFFPHPKHFHLSDRHFIFWLVRAIVLVICLSC